MSASNRASLITKTWKVLKKHYRPSPGVERTVLEHLLYACCLENSAPEQVDEVLATLQQRYFDWNEVRVTSIAELAETMSNLSDPSESAARLKRTLHSVFETYYSFDLEFLKKQGLGKSVGELEKLNHISSFSVAYVTQHALNGHAVPLNQGAMDVFLILGVINEAEASKGKVPGLERAVTKNKGLEFASLIQQFGADYRRNPFSTRVRGIIMEIEPDAKDRLPKREKGAAPETKLKSPKPKSGKGKKSESKKSQSEEKEKTSADKPGAAKKSESEATKKSPSKRLSRKKPR